MSNSLDNVTLDDSVPVFDTVQALIVADRDIEFLQEVIVAFVDDLTNHLTRLDTIISSGNYNGVQDVAHGVKGAAASLGAQRIRAVALALELVGKSQDLSDAPRLLDIMKSEYELFSEYVKTFDWESL